MKVLLTEKVRALQRDADGSKQLRIIIATAKLNEPREIKVSDKKGQERIYKARLVPSQG